MTSEEPRKYLASIPHLSQPGPQTRTCPTARRQPQGCRDEEPTEPADGAHRTRNPAVMTNTVVIAHIHSLTHVSQTH